LISELEAPGRKTIGKDLKDLKDLKDNKDNKDHNS